MKPKVIFFQIENTAQKLIKIASMAHYHFLNKEPLLLLAPSPKAVEYVEALLWQEPPEGFLPHEVSEIATDELIVITEKEQNLNKANYLLNLCVEMPAFSFGFKVTYDFEEKNRRAAFEKKYKSYRDKGYAIESQPI